MKKLLSFVLVMFLMTGCFASGSAAAETKEAKDVTQYCRAVLSYNRDGWEPMTDGGYMTVWQSGKNGWLEMHTPENMTCYGLYISWGLTITDCELQTLNEQGEWVLYKTLENNGCYNRYVPIEEGSDHLRLYNPTDTEMCISEIHLFGEGTVPDYVQDWQPFTGKADLMVIVAHADDEWIYFGGVIPYYAQVLGKRVLPVYIASMPYYRQSEILDGLWACGIRELPIAPGTDFKDVYPLTAEEVAQEWGMEKVQAHLTGLIRQYRPDVIVTHDIKGEYGHPAHQMVSLAVRESIELPGNAEAFPASAEEYGIWQPQKLYVHLYDGEMGVIRFDWNQKQAVFGGRTALEMAQLAFTKHRSQYGGGKYRVEDGGQFDNARFGLYYSAVGADEACDDFFEHVQ